MTDPRNRPALMGAVIAGFAAFGLLWLVGVSAVVAWLVGWSMPAFVAYGVDKRQALAGRWRIPEALLHGLALAGGVAGAWAGRAVFRHKTREPVFLVVLVAASVLWAAILLVDLVR